MTEMFRDKIDISLTVNGEPVEARVPAGQHLVDFLRGELGLTGAHASCEHGVCGACTLKVDGKAVRGCLMLAAQVDQPAGPVLAAMRKQGVLVCAAGATAVRFLPAFTSTTAELDEMVAALGAALAELAA